MRRAWLAVAILVCCVGIDARPAGADERARPRAPVPLAAPPAQGHVPVPDVRGLSEEEAVRAIYEAGLRLGGVERVSIEKLEAELGRRYEPGLVVQQAPRPSVGENPSWLPRGSPVWLRLSAGTRAVEVPPAPVAPVPVPPTPYVPPPLPPQPVVPYTPPPPGPATVPYVPPATQPLDATPEPFDAALLGPVAQRTRLACERGRGEWHVRARGGWAWWFGADSGSSGAYAGADVGYTFGDCFGVDVFYRYTSTRFRRTTGGSTLQDGGDIHFLGAKVTYESAVSRASEWFFWAGLGGGWVKTRRFIQDDSGFGILGEAGIGYLIDNSVRVRLGVTITGILTDVGRNDPANDGSTRWLTSVAPTLGLEIDL